MLHHGLVEPAPPKRVVVIGAGGFVGGAIARQAQAAGIPTLALTRAEVDLLSSGGAEALRSHLTPEDAVVFVSAVAPARNVAQLMLNLRMAETACVAFAAVPPAHLVYVSSDAVYADDANPVTESSALAPTTLHGMMHAARELMFRTDYRGPFAALRPTLIYGARDPHSGYGPNRFRRQAARGEPITIFGEGEEQRDHVAVEDVARLAVRILLRRSSGALNAVSGRSVAFREIAEWVKQVAGPPVEVLLVPRPGPRPHLTHRFFDITNLHKAFPDFHPEPPASGIARVQREVAEGAAA